jgi:D-3-phosphoglycerate dehydrogenase
MKSALQKGLTLPNLIFDFDSTLVSVESLDELARIALRGKPDRDVREAEIRNITNLGMEGKLPFAESLSRRMALFTASEGNVHELVEFLRNSLSPSVARNVRFFQAHRDRIYIVSSGFREYIAPIAEMLGLPAGHVAANSLRYDGAGLVSGPDSENPLMRVRGKSRAVASFGLEGGVAMIGDGYTDYEVREDGAAQAFIAFTENVARPPVLEKADYLVANIEELLYLLEIPAP